MRSPRIDSRFIFLALLSALLWTGCAQQDLYEPPGAPFLRVGTLPLPSQNEGVAVMGNYAFVAGGQAGLHAIDFTIPSQPFLLQTINTVKYSESIEVVRTFVDHQILDVALVVEGTEGITTYDITDPSSVTSFHTRTTGLFANRIFVEQPEDPDEAFVVYVAESWKGIRVFTSIPDNPGILDSPGVFVGTNGYAEGIVVRDGFGYVADDEMGLSVVDLLPLNLHSVSLVGWADSPGSALDVELEGNYAYVADGREGLAIFRINGGENPVRVTNLDLEGNCRAVAVRDGLAVLAAQGGGVHFVDVSNPAHPVFLGRILTSYAMDLAISDGGFVLVADRDEGLIVMQGPNAFKDQTPPAAVQSLSAQPWGEGAIRLDWYATGDDRMFGTASSQEIRVADSPITDLTTWHAATLLSGVPAPAAPGVNMILKLWELDDGEKHFAIRCTDDAGLVSGLSNPVGLMPGEGFLLVDSSLNPKRGTPSDTFNYDVTFVYPHDPTVAEVVIDGIAHTMSPVETDGHETLFRYQTQLPELGEHSYFFHFAVADPEILDTTTPTTIGPTVGSIFFVMGSSATTDTTDVAYEPVRNLDEWQHTAVLGYRVIAAETEVTQREWKARDMVNPSHFQDDDRPVESITWREAIRYCNALSDSEGREAAYDTTGQRVAWNRTADGWRLPTEAEWEWLCRGDSLTAFAGGPLTGRICNPDPVLLEMGWYCGSDFEGVPGTRNVEMKTPNSFGLHDMHGNVWEWCWDWYGDYRLEDPDGDGVVFDPVGPSGGTQRVVRGGSWYGGSEDCRSAKRGSRYPDSVENVVGLRVVRTDITSK
jgi:hypothetical protein